MKRLIDIVVSALGLILCSPFMVVIAALIALESSGPVIFRQRRVGQFGVEFGVLKFRTMRMMTAEGPQVTIDGDPRITRIGRWLRSTKLDELPQLVNVLSGDMSLIGPRPEVPAYVQLWPEGDRRTILSIRPGISDPGSIVFRREAELLAAAEDPEQFYREVILPQKVALYVEYANTATTLGDLRLLWRSVRAVVAD